MHGDFSAVSAVRFFEQKIDTGDILKEMVAELEFTAKNMRVRNIQIKKYAIGHEKGG